VEVALLLLTAVLPLPLDVIELVETPDAAARRSDLAAALASNDFRVRPLFLSAVQDVPAPRDTASDSGDISNTAVAATVGVNVVAVVAFLNAVWASGYDAVAAARYRAQVSAAVRVNGVGVVAGLNVAGAGGYEAIAAEGKRACKRATICVIGVSVVALLTRVSNSITATCTSAIRTASIGLGIGVIRAVVAAL